MNQSESAALLRERLFDGSDFEVAGSDAGTGMGYRVTLRSGEVDVAAFSRLDSSHLRSCIEAGLPPADRSHDVSD